MSSVLALVSPHITAPAYAEIGSWGAVEDVGLAVDNAWYYAEYRDVVVEPSGAVTAVGIVGTNVVASTRTTGGVWGAPVTLGPGNRVFVGVDSLGNVTVVWQEKFQTEASVRTATRTAAGVWGAATTVAADGARLQDMAVGPGGSVVVVMQRNNANPNHYDSLATVRPPGGSFSAPITLIAESEIGGASIAFTGPATATVAYNASRHDVMAIDWAAGSWGSPTPLATITQYDPRLDLTANAAGDLALSVSTSSTVRALTRRGGAWSAPYDVMVGVPGRTSPNYVRTAMGSDGYAWVAWLNSNNVSHAIAAYESPLTGWSTPRESASEPDESFRTLNLVVDAQGEPTIAWERQEVGHNPTIARWSGTDFAGELVPGLIGGAPVLRVGAHDRAVALFAPTTGPGTQAVVAEPSGLEMELAIFDDDGQAIDGLIVPGEELRAEVTLVNHTGETVEDITYANGDPLVVDPRSPGGLAIVGEPADEPPLSLEDGESVTLPYDLTALDNGLAAAHTKITGTGADTSTEQEVKGSLRFDIADGATVDSATLRIIAMQALDAYVMQKIREYEEVMADRGADLKKRLKKLLPKELFNRWYSNDGISPLEQQQAAHQVTAPELVDARLPDKKYQGHSVEELNDAYDKSFKAEIEKGIEEYVVGALNGASKAGKAAKEAYGEALIGSFYIFGNETPQERAYFEAKMVKVADSQGTAYKNIVKTVNAAGPTWKDKRTAVGEATLQAVNSAYVKGKNYKNELVNSEKKARTELLKLAETDPVRFQKEWAKRDAAIANFGIARILDVMIGSAGGEVTKVGKVKVRGRGLGVIESGKAAGVLGKEGKVVKAATTAIPEAIEGGAITGLEAKAHKQFLKELDGATVIQSTDAGKVYALPNQGGVPEPTIAKKADILGELEDGYTTSRGKPLQLAEVVKPGSELRKEGGVAKLELTEPKTGKPVMLTAGAPPQILGEASVWSSPTPPSALPGWEALSAAEQQQATAAWKKANADYASWRNPKPGSKNAKLKQCLGKRGTVRLDDSPNAEGVTRWVTAEFETVHVTEGKAKGELIRVKYYKVEARIGDKVVNSRVVVDSKVARPQTPDADSVALAKVVGKAPDGRPLLAPLNREEREYVMQRYIDKNVKARRSGLMPEAAEHSVTLVMDDASAIAAGKLLPAYGVPFLTEDAGLAYLRRIAKFVAPKGVSEQEMFDKMKKQVLSDGGFGQHAVVVTRDSRYFGELAVSEW